MAFNIKLTDNGRIELAKAEMGMSLEFNYVAIGDGNNKEATNTKKSLSNQLYKLEVLKVSRAGSQIIVECDLSNLHVETGFYFRELGIYANNILYAYGNAGEFADYVDRADSSVAIESRIRLVLDIGETANVIINTQSTMYALQKDFDTHTKEENPHGLKEITAEEIFAMYGGDVEVGGIGDAEIGIGKAGIDEMYENNLTYSVDTGIPNDQIDKMYEN